MKRRFISVITLLLACSLLLTGLCPCFAEEEELPALDAKAAVLMDAASGELLYYMNPDTPLYVAGLTVMMTSLLAAEAVDREEISFDDVVTASSSAHNDITADASIQNIVPGEEMTLEDLLYCAIVGGASEACNIIGEYVAGSSSAFVSLMNARAKELGCTGTHFVNCHGLPNDEHYSTARDMALIASAFVQHIELMDIANSVSREIPSTNVSGARKLTSSNYILRTDYTRYYYSYACGIKTSYTDEAGFCLASSMKTGDNYVVSIMLGCKSVPTEDGFTDILSFTQTKKLFQWFNSRYSLRDIVSMVEPIMEVPVELGEGTDSVVVCSAEGLSLFLPNDLDIATHYEREIEIYSLKEGAQPLTAPISRGQVLGELTVRADTGITFGPFDLVANTDVAISRVELIRQRFHAMLDSTWFKFGLIVVLLILILYIVFVSIYRARRRKIRRSLREQRRAEREAASKDRE